MVRISRAIEINARPSAVFDAFVDPGKRQRLMAGYVEKVEVDGHGLGSVYSMHTAEHLGGGCVVEQTVTFDPDRCEMGIVMTDTGGVVPFADYRSTIRVQRAGPGRSVLNLASSFVPIELDEDAAKSLAEQNYDMVFAALATMFPEDE